uniref:lysophospholipid acyltransferase family protein n=1 Tax=uncultured Propionibacterium sp. TaxID=218066 RepID=UPI0029307C1B
GPAESPDSPSSQPTPDELTRVEQVPRPGRVRAVWGWTRRAARSTQQALSVHAEGLENLPAGGAVLAANHVWAGDFARLRAALDRPVHLAADSAGRLPGRRVPIDDPEQGGDAAGELADGGLVLVFPEGAPSPDGDIHRGGTDVAWLALTARAPVVPVGIVPAAVGPRPLKPVTRRVFGPKVIIGVPLDFSRFWEIPALSYALDGVLLRGVTDEIMGAIAALTGRAYTDTTPAQAKELAAAARRQNAWARANEYPTASQVRRAEAERREMLRERDEQDLARAAAEAQARARTGRNEGRGRARR